jgi:uridine phosphorylase
MGSCRGVGLEPGQLVVTEECLNNDLEPYLEQIVLGSKIRRESVYSKQVAENLLKAGRDLNVPIIKGKTLTSYGLYDTNREGLMA